MTTGHSEAEPFRSRSCDHWLAAACAAPSSWEVFGWIKGSAGLSQTKHRGRERVAWRFGLTAAAYNLICLPKLLTGAAA